jgi:hypothetical protein
MPGILLFAKNIDWSLAAFSDRVSLLGSTDLASLCSVVAGKLRIPYRFAEREVLPQLIVDMTEHFSARCCRAEDPSEALRQGHSGETFIHLYRTQHCVPDFASDEWNSRAWAGYELGAAAYSFVLQQATKSLFAPFVLTKLGSSSPHASKSLLSRFSPRDRYSYRDRELKVTFPRKPDSFELEVGRFLGLS